MLPLLADVGRGDASGLVQPNSASLRSPSAHTFALALHKEVAHDGPAPAAAARERDVHVPGLVGPGVDGEGDGVAAVAELHGVARFGEPDGDRGARHAAVENGVHRHGDVHGDGRGPVVPVDVPLEVRHGPELGGQVLEHVIVPV